MLIKPVYDAYLERFLSAQRVGVPNPVLLTPLEFVRLPFQVRLNLAGAYLVLAAPERIGLNIKKFLVPEIPEIAFAPGSDSNLSWNDIFIIKDGEYWMLFPFEYQIVFE